MILHRYKYCNATSSGVRPYNTQVQYTTPGVRRGYKGFSQILRFLHIVIIKTHQLTQLSVQIGTQLTERGLLSS